MKTTTVLQLSETFHNRYSSIVSYLQHPLLLLIRLYWGYDFFQTGLGKLNNLEGTTEFFVSLNIPFPAFQAFFVGNVEMIFGILLMIGLGARYFTVPLIVIMSVAYLTDDREALLNIFTDPESFVFATPFLHFFALLIIYTFGAGIVSLDAFLIQVRKRMATKK